MGEWLSTPFEGWTFHHSGPLLNKPVILALHGFTGSGFDYCQLAEHPSAPSGVSWIAPDLPGHGKTGVLPANDCHLEAMAAVLSRFIHQYRLKPHLLGYSMGGRLALQLATSGIPLSGLSLIGAHPGILSENERLERKVKDSQLAERIRTIGSGTFADEWESQPIIRSQNTIPQPYLEELRRRRREQPAEGLARSLEAAGTGVMPQLWQQLDEIACPVYYYYGAEDSKFRIIASQIAKVAQGFIITEISNTGHCAHLENTTEFLEAFVAHH